MRKKRHLTEIHLSDFACVGRDILMLAYDIKAAMTKFSSDPCPSLIRSDALNDSYLKMDVRRVTRFAACHEFFLALANGEWDGKKIPYEKMGLKEPSPEQCYSFLGMSKFASSIKTIFIDCVQSYRVATWECLERAEKAAGELLVWHLQFNPDLTSDHCFGACLTRYQLEGLFGLLRSFRRLLNMADTARASWKEANNGCDPPYYLFTLRFGRLSNSYIEGRFSIFRCAVGNAPLDGVSAITQFKSMMAREMRGMMRLGIERADYSGQRKFVEQLNDEQDAEAEQSNSE